MRQLVDQQVQTPIGPGTVTATWIRANGRRRVLVSMPLTAANRQHLQDANCMSRGSESFGLWSFDVQELLPVND